MGSLHSAHPVIAEISHQINSPLAAIRNALYLAASRSKDEEVRRYLELANEEVTVISRRLKELRELIEAGAHSEKSTAAPSPVQKMSQAA